MARTRQIASVSYRGFLPFRRHVESATVVDLPYQAVERAARVCLGQLVADSLGDAEAPRPRAVAPVGHWLRRLKVAVEPEVSSDRAHSGALGHEHWHARRLQRLVPDMEADLIVEPLSGGRTRLILEVTYRPPGGLLGAVGDGLVGHVVARSTADAFVGRLAQSMERAVREHHCGSWAPTRREVA